MRAGGWSAGGWSWSEGGKPLGELSLRVVVEQLLLLLLLLCAVEQPRTEEE